MYISQLLPKHQGSKAALFTSIIEPDNRNIYRNVEFVSKKIALADKTLIKQYKERSKKEHPNVPQLTITQTSEFYVTINLEKCKPFQTRDLIIIPFNQRAKVLADILRGSFFLLQLYGYFYLTAKMLSYSADGQVNVWINQDYFCNRPQYAINHGKFSEQIFIADFKQTFGGIFQQMKQFGKAKNVSSLLKFLNRGQEIYHSLLMSEPVTKESLICRDYTLKFSSVLNSHTKEYFGEERRAERGLKHAESMNSIIIHVNNQNYEEYQEKERKMSRTLSSPDSIKMNSNNSPRAQNIQRIAYGSLTSQNLPKINFSYCSKNAWKKKANEPISQVSHFKSLKIRQADNESTSVRQSSKQFLKVSFPYTTTHSFSPLASFGSIDLNSARYNIQQDAERAIEGGKKLDHKIEIGIQQIGQIQLQFQNLFQSNTLSAEQELQNLQVIMQEFENILEG